MALKPWLKLRNGEARGAGLGEGDGAASLGRACANVARTQNAIAMIQRAMMSISPSYGTAVSGHAATTSTRRGTIARYIGC